MATFDFYDKLAPFYHLIFENWETSIERQGAALDSIIRSAANPSAKSVLDVACGIGTQALDLAARGYRVTASDISREAVARARTEASQRNLAIEFSVADMLAAYKHQERTFDVVLCADNSLPHLLTDREILQALGQFFACTEPGGLCVISVRDYAAVSAAEFSSNLTASGSKVASVTCCSRFGSGATHCMTWIFTWYGMQAMRVAKRM